MTILEYLMAELDKCGMFPETAAAVIELAMEQNGTLAAIANKKVKDYPPMIMKVLWISTKHTALDYIEEHEPQAWYKLMFVG